MGIEEDDIDPERFLEDVEMRVGEVVSVDDFPGPPFSASGFLASLRDATGTAPRKTWAKKAARSQRAREQFGR